MITMLTFALRGSCAGELDIPRTALKASLVLFIEIS